VFRCDPIGFIHTPFTDLQGIPIQPIGARGVEGSLELKPKFSAGLKDVEGFSHLIILYQFHCSKGFSLTVRPFLDSRRHGVFATRAPRRPNPIGMSVVRLIRRERAVLWVLDIDVVDGTPLLDIKPYVPEFDVRKAVRIGWLGGKAKRARRFRSDRRFVS